MTLPATEAADPLYADLERWPLGTAMAALWGAQMDAVAAVRAALPQIEAAAVAAHDRLRDGGRLVYVGAGTSGRIGVQDGAELTPTFDWPTDRLLLLIAGGDTALTRSIENAEDDAATATRLIGAHAIGPTDVVICTAASGNTPYTVAAIVAARAAGALTIGISNSADSRLLHAAAQPILVETGAEPIVGSTRLKAGTAQKVVLNLLSTSIMLQQHRVFRGRMVDMQATNAKLRMRGTRMLMDLTDCTESAAAAALRQAGDKVKLAVLIVLGSTTAEAHAQLTSAKGDLRRALVEKATPTPTSL